MNIKTQQSNWCLIRSVAFQVRWFFTDDSESCIVKTKSTWYHIINVEEMFKVPGSRLCVHGRILVLMFQLRTIFLDTFARRYRRHNYYWHITINNNYFWNEPLCYSPIMVMTFRTIVRSHSWCMYTVDCSQSFRRLPRRLTWCNAMFW